MEMNGLIDKYFAIVQKEHLYSSKDNLMYYLKYIFKGITFNDKKLLDIGGGAGLFSFYAACMGSEEVICLEPGVAGSTEREMAQFETLLKGLHVSDKVKRQSTTFQNFDPDDKRFAIILLHNSINHLDEEACAKLRYDTSAVKAYTMIFEKLSRLAQKGGKLIISDCSRHNFYAWCKLKNPFNPTMEWQKHQSPSYWAKLLSDVGFCNPVIRWTSFNRLGAIGRLVLGNKYASYFLNSHFCLIMDKQ